MVLAFLPRYIMINLKNLKNHIVNSLYSGNSDNPDKMPLNAAFHQGLYCLLR